MRKAPLSLMLIATLAFAPLAEAKNRDKSWEFGALVGHIDGDRSAEVGNGISGELRFGYNFSSKVMAELWLSDERAEQGNRPDYLPLAIDAVPESACPANFPNNPPAAPCLAGISTISPDVNKEVEFRRAIVTVTGNFLTDREGNTIPYISAGLGFIQETREGYPFEAKYFHSADDPNDPNTLRIITLQDTSGDVPEAFDSSAILTLAVGARTFFNDNWGIRYEVAYSHHNSFQVNQDEYAVRVGATWIFGGQK